MLRAAIGLLAAGVLAGCSANASFTPSASSNNQSESQLAAYAGRATYPTTMPASDDLKAAAMISPDGRVLKIYNFGREPIENADIWVNGAFVYHVYNIAPQSSFTINSTDLFNSVGASFASQGAPCSRVQIQTDSGLFTLWGPASM